jgi:hypothetical protein
MPRTSSFRARLQLAAVPLALAFAVQAVALPSFAELPPAPSVDVQPSAESKEQFRLGVSLLQDPDGARYEEAFKAFMRAYRLSPSWKILGNLGLSAMKLERYTDGIAAYERYLAEGGAALDPAERQQIEKDLSVMKATSGTVTLLVTGASNVVVKDTRARSVGGPIVNSYEVPAGGRVVLAVAAGEHTLVAAGEGRSASLDLNVEAGSSVQQTLTLAGGAGSVSGGAGAAADESSAPSAPASTSASPSTSDGSSSTLRTTGIVVGGVGVAALIGGGITGFLGLGKKGDFDDRCPDKKCVYVSDAERSSIESDREAIETMETLTTALLIGGGVLTAAGVTLYVVGGPSSQESVSFAPSVAPGLAGLSARGAF